MSKKTSLRRGKKPAVELAAYDDVLAGIVELLETARRTSARAVNAVMTATYWEVGRRIVEGEQQGAGRAEYGSRLIKRLSGDLTARFGRGFGVVNLAQMRRFYLAWAPATIFQTVSEKSASGPEATSCGRLEAAPITGIFQTPSEKSPPDIAQTASAKLAMPRFPLSWSHYVKLLSVQDPEARAFYETEALRGGCSGFENRT